MKLVDLQHRSSSFSRFRYTMPVGDIFIIYTLSNTVSLAVFADIASTRVLLIRTTRNTLNFKKIEDTFQTQIVNNTYVYKM